MEVEPMTTTHELGRQLLAIDDVPVEVDALCSRDLQVEINGRGIAVMYDRRTHEGGGEDPPKPKTWRELRELIGEVHRRQHADDVRGAHKAAHVLRTVVAELVHAGQWDENRWPAEVVRRSKRGR